MGVFQKDVASLTHPSLPWGVCSREAVGCEGWASTRGLPPGGAPIRRQGVGAFFGQSWKGLQATLPRRGN